MKIYALIDPRTRKIKYIGTTAQALDSRVAQHKYDTKSGRGGSQKIGWLASLYEKGLDPAIICLESGLSQKEAEWAERKWIRLLRKTKGVKLTNRAGGGKGQLGMLHTAEEKQKIAEGVKRARNKK